MISVVVPVFNTRCELFQRCIDSILNQTYQHFEIVVVDDGSKAACSAQIQKICEKDDRIHYNRTENNGVSSARNYGMRLAKFQYITFVDSDDEIISCFFEEVVRIIEETKAELIIGGLVNDGDSYVLESFQESLVHIVQGENVSGFKKHLIDEWITLKNGGHINRGPVVRVVKRDIALRNPFKENLKIGEDIIWNLCLISSLSCFVFVERVWYIYHNNPLSATHKYNPNIISEEREELEELIKHIDVSNEVEYIAYNNHIFECLKRIYDCYLKDEWNKTDIRKRALSELYNDFPWTKVSENSYIEKVSGNNKVKAKLFKLKLLFVFWKLKDYLA